MAVYQPRSASAQATAAPSDVEALQAELGREQERLRKLWDAFKSQEDEIASLRSAPAPAATLAAAPSASDARNNESFRREVDLLTSDLRRAAETQRRLEAENRELAEAAGGHADVARRVPQLESELAEERERLAKLYAVYEEVEAARKALESRLKEWEAWYHGVNPHLSEIFRSVGGAPYTK